VNSIFRSSLVALFLCILASNRAHAELVIGGDLFDVTWDRAADPSGSDFVAIPILWTGTGNDQITSFNFGFTIEGGDSGTLVIDQPSAEFPTINPIFASFTTATPILTDAAPGVLGVAGENGSFANVTVPTTGRNTVAFRFTSADAVGTFNVFAVEEFSSYFRVGDGDVTPFANSYVDGRLLLGTVTVNATAVPEPSSLLLVGAFASAAAVIRRRRK